MSTAGAAVGQGGQPRFRPPGPQQAGGIRTARLGEALRTVGAEARPRGGAVTNRDPALVRLQDQRADVVGMAAGRDERAEAVLEVLARFLPFDSGWLAVRDPERRRHVPLAT